MKYKVIALYTASKVIGTYEADNKEQAIEIAYDDEQADSFVTLCHHCSGEVDIGDAYEYIAEEDDG